MYITYTYYYIDLHLICIVGIFPLFRLNILFVSDLSYTSLTVYVMIFIVIEIKKPGKLSLLALVNTYVNHITSVCIKCTSDMYLHRILINQNE